MASAPSGDTKIETNNTKILENESKTSSELNQQQEQMQQLQSQLQQNLESKITNQSEQNDLEILQRSIDEIHESLNATLLDIDEIGDDVEIIPAVLRILTSPPPTSTSSFLMDGFGFPFVNVDPEEDVDGSPFYATQITTQLTRDDSSVSLFGGEIDAMAEDADAAKESILHTEAGTVNSSSPKEIQSSRVSKKRPRKSAGIKTPLLRPSTPTIDIKKEDEDGTSKIENVSDFDKVVNDAELISKEDEVAVLLVEGIDRETIISNIRMSLDLKDKYKSKNSYLQHKLGEYFRRKRVFFKYYILLIIKYVHKYRLMITWTEKNQWQIKSFVIQIACKHSQHYTPNTKT